ncbi:MAG: M20/M25/M40 family metallo-hydrolase [Nakamurella sp.]
MTGPTLLTHLADTIVAEAQSRREELVMLCGRLVAARSVNPDGDTREVADIVSEFLRSRGIESRLERQVEHMPSVIAELDSGRPGPHLVLNVHMDTMPPGDESAWSVPVWELTRTQGRLYGIGMGNMKGAVAAMLHAVDLLHGHRESWCGTVTFTAVSDEVVFGDNGAAFLLREHPHLVGDALICGEGPGYRRLAIGEKGVLWLEIGVTGDAGHSSSVRAGRSASARLAAAVTAVDGLTGYRGDALPMDLHSLLTMGAELDLTANVGTMTAGTFIGQVATAGRAEVDLRLPPGIDVDTAERMVRAAVTAAVPDADAAPTVRRIKGWDANVTAPGNRLVRSWHQATVAADIAEPAHAIRLPASDASRWRHLGVPAVCYGPQPTLSAGVDDYADEDEVVNCVALYTLAAVAFTTGGGAHDDLSA